ncbi:MAG TPA: isocitrate lyase/phosphoenolpyruvate mutase family protein [Thermoanaerobaculia bacterium]|nr:isocitrate lyase/phosphoenolpyruvate mutase family protein [Thermoanaerobaculia bacterium]
MAIAEGLSQKAEALRALHRPGRPLVLVNAWDVASARMIEEAGSKAVATTSAGVAFSLGFPDGQRISREKMLQAVAPICAAVSVPVTADMEAGYGDTAEEMDRTASGVVEAGAVGLNLEDGTGRDESPLLVPETHAAKIRAVVEGGRRRGVHLVVNARIDVYLDQVGPESGRLEDTIRRGLAYRDAGASCIFVPGVIDPSVIAALVDRLDCPVNVLAVAGGPSISELAKLGVARVSLGSGPMRAAMTLTKRLAEEVLSSGTYSALEGASSHAAFNKLMAR